MDDASCFIDIRLGPKTSECEKHGSVKSTVTGCDVTYCATTLQWFNKHKWLRFVCLFVLFVACCLWRVVVRCVVAVE